MAYTITHLIIGYRLLDAAKPENPDDFLLGSIIPDAVHTRENYCREMKAESHFMPPQLGWGTLKSMENTDIWLSSILERYTESVSACGGETDFLRGILVHILTDVFNAKTVMRGLMQAHPELDYSIVAREQGALDAFLYRTCPYMPEMFHMLAESRGHPVKGLLSAEDIRKFRELTLRKYEEEPNAGDVSKNILFPPSANRRLIEDSLEYLLHGQDILLL